MTDYVVTVAAKGNDIVLRASGDLNAAAASHLLEMAGLALSVRCSSVTIDLVGVDSCTPMADRLLARRGGPEPSGPGDRARRLVLVECRRRGPTSPVGAT